jgi:hypothetical protein
MAGLMNELVSGVVASVLKEILKKTGGRIATKRQRRQARSATTGRFKKVSAKRAAKPAKKQLSRRRTAASRSKAR